MGAPIIRADHIPWDLTPTPHLERIPASGAYLSDLPHEDLLNYALDLREDAASLRFTLHQALAYVAHLTSKCRELTDEVHYLRAERRQRAA